MIVANDIEVQAFNAFDKLREEQGGVTYILWAGNYYNSDSWQEHFVFTIYQDKASYEALMDYLSTLK